jgi:hypothetical protein
MSQRFACIAFAIYFLLAFCLKLYCSQIIQQNELNIGYAGEALVSPDNNFVYFFVSPNTVVQRPMYDWNQTTVTNIPSPFNVVPQSMIDPSGDYIYYCSGAGYYNEFIGYCYKYTLPDMGLVGNVYWVVNSNSEFYSYAIIGIVKSTNKMLIALTNGLTTSAMVVIDTNTFTVTSNVSLTSALGAINSCVTTSDESQIICATTNAIVTFNTLDLTYQTIASFGATQLFWDSTTTILYAMYSLNLTVWWMNPKQLPLTQNAVLILETTDQLPSHIATISPDNDYILLISSFEVQVIAVNNDEEGNGITFSLGFGTTVQDESNPLCATFISNTLAYVFYGESFISFTVSATTAPTLNTDITFNEYNDFDTTYPLTESSDHLYVYASGATIYAIRKLDLVQDNYWYFGDFLGEYSALATITSGIFGRAFTNDTTLIVFAQSYSAYVLVADIIHFQIATPMLAVTLNSNFEVFNVVVLQNSMNVYLLSYSTTIQEPNFQITMVNFVNSSYSTVFSDTLPGLKAGDSGVGVSHYWYFVSTSVLYKVDFNGISIKNYSIPSADSCVGLILSPDGNSLYIHCINTNNMYLVQVNLTTFLRQNYRNTQIADETIATNGQESIATDGYYLIVSSASAIYGFGFSASFPQEWTISMPLSLRGITVNSSTFFSYYEQNFYQVSLVYVTHACAR